MCVAPSSNTQRDTDDTTSQAPVLRHSDAARAQGYGITLHLDARSRSEVDEFSTSGFIGVKKSLAASPSTSSDVPTLALSGYTLVVPSSPQIIASITSSSIVALGASLGMAIEKRAVTYAELGSFVEVMAAGTAAALVPIRSISMKSKGDKIVYLEGEAPGKVCEMLLKALQAVQRGESEDQWGWCQKVERPEGVTIRGEGRKSGAGDARDEAGVKSAVVDQ